MTKAGRAAVAILVMLAGAGLTPPARAADVEVESESVFSSYSAPGLTSDQQNVVLQPFTQSFRLEASEREKNLQISFETYFRGVEDTTNPYDPGVQQQARVYYAFVDIQSGLRNPVEFRIGRQMETTAGDLFAFDGVLARYRGPLHLGLEAFAGTTVSGYGAVVPLGLDDGGVNEAGGYVGGAAIYMVGIPGSEARLSFTREERSGEVDREDLELGGAQRVGLRTRLYGNVEVSTVLGELEEATVGGTLYAGHATFVDLEGFHYLPTFGASSIFNVFSVAPYNEARFRVHGTALNGTLGLWARVGYALYAAGETSDNVSAGGNADLSKHVTLSARIYLSNGYQGSRDGGGGELHYKITDRVQAFVGGTAAASDAVLLPNAKGTYLSVLGGAQYSIPDRLDLSLYGEQYSDPVIKNAPRLEAALRFQFGTGTARKAALDASSRRVH